VLYGSLHVFANFAQAIDSHCVVSRFNGQFIGIFHCLISVFASLYHLSFGLHDSSL